MATNKNPIKRKRIYTSEVDDSDSEYENHFRGSQSGCLNAWAKFLVVKSVNESDDILKVSPFIVHKWFQGVSPTGIREGSVKKLRLGGYLLECLTEKTSRLFQTLKNPTINGIPVKISPHDSLNSSKGVIRCGALQGMSDLEICQGLVDQGVKQVKRVRVTKDSKKVDTHTFFLTFVTPSPPKHIKVGFLRVLVDSFTPSPMRCFNCQEFGHSSKACKKPPICRSCGHAKHDGDCSGPIKCTNCQGDHPPSSKQKCPKWIEENEIQKVKTQQRCSFSEAKKIVCKSDASYVNALKNGNQAIPSKNSKPVTPVSSETSSATRLEERFMALMENMDKVCRD